MTPRWITYRPLKDINLDQFNKDIENIPWDSALRHDVNDSVIAFNALLKKLYDTHAPIKKSYVREQSYPWITETIKTMMKLRDDAHAKSRRTKLENHKKYYKELKNIVSVALHNEKTAYFQQFINKNVNDSRTLWKNLKQNIVDFNKKNKDL